MKDLNDANFKAGLTLKQKYALLREKKAKAAEAKKNGAAGKKGETALKGEKLGEVAQDDKAHGFKRPRAPPKKKQEDTGPKLKKRQRSELETAPALDSFPTLGAVDESDRPSHGTIFINDLSYMCSEKELLRTFKRFGFVDSVHMVHSKGCAYITFASATSAARAIAEMNGSLFCGQKIYVSVAQGEIPEDAVEMWRRKRMPMDDSENPGEGGDGEFQRKPRNTWGDETGPPPAGQETSQPADTRQMVVYDDDVEEMDSVW